MVNPISEVTVLCVQGGWLSPNIPQGKKRIDVYLSEEEERRFRETVFKRKGMKKGNISEAMGEAVLLWMNTEPVSQGRRSR